MTCPSRIRAGAEVAQLSHCLAGSRPGSRPILLPVLALLIAGAAYASGGAYRHPEMGLSLWLPDAWSVDIDSISVVAYGPGREPRFEVRALGAGESADEAGHRALARLRSDIRRLQERAAWRATTLGSISGRRWDGEGLEAGNRKTLHLLVWRARRTWLMALWVVEQREAARHEETWRRIALGLRAVGEDR
ncbi:hypothetical protein [Paludibaculum fermentans]|uniref:hypothetical protein n=1 Tax=Paludibaculum fermentans TaxID=1473598 RepID=UPI003EBB6598